MGLFVDTWNLDLDLWFGARHGWCWTCASAVLVLPRPWRYNDTALIKAKWKLRCAHLQDRLRRHRPFALFALSTLVFKQPQRAREPRQSQDLRAIEERERLRPRSWLLHRRRRQARVSLLRLKILTFTFGSRARRGWCWMCPRKTYAVDPLYNTMLVAPSKFYLPGMSASRRTLFATSRTSRVP